MSAHTPGPWKADTWAHEKAIRLTGDKVRRITPLGGPSIAYLPEGREDIIEANAHLIAAAPELLEACKAGLRFYKGGDSSGLNWDSFADILKAAIAKAEGGQDEMA